LSRWVVVRSQAARFAAGAEKRLRAAVVVLAAGLFSFPSYAALQALGLPTLACATGVAALCAAGGWVSYQRLPNSLETSWHEHRRAWYLGAAAAIGAALLLSRLSMFMVDPSVREASTLPKSDFLTHHSCYTAYFEAARSVDTASNIYDPELYRPGGEARSIDGFQVDLYEYPPPFLLAPRLMAALASGFVDQRVIWFWAQLCLLAGAAFGLSAWAGRGRVTAPALLVPTLLLALPVRMTLQIGNFQPAAFALSILGMLAFERRRRWLGGALLAFPLLAKVFPGVLLVYLLVRRRYRDLAAVCVFALAYAVLAFGSFGRAPFESFLSFQLPRLESGEAFPLLKLPYFALINHSFSGVIVKLGMVGVPHMSFGVAAAVGWAYSLGLLALAVALSRRSLGRIDQARLWLVLLGLAALRSPFVPQAYAVLAPLWLCTWIPAGPKLRPWSVGALLVAWEVLNLSIPPDLSERLGLGLAGALTAIPQLCHFGVLAVTVGLLARRAEVAPAGVAEVARRSPARPAPAASAG
jgi:alpha-1,2-mannosyltransferase